VRKTERGSERENEKERERGFLFLKGMTGALAPFSYLVVNKLRKHHSYQILLLHSPECYSAECRGSQKVPRKFFSIKDVKIFCLKR
jgi:hypothetical protein